MKKLVFLGGDFNRSGGTERVCSLVANGLARRGYDVVVASVECGDRPFFELDPSIRVAALFRTPGRALTRAPLLVARLRRLLLEEKADLLVSVESMLALFTIPATLGLPMKHVCWEHFHFKTDLGKRGRRVARRLAARFCDNVVTLTERDKALWQQGTPLKAAICAIPNPLSFPVQPAPEALHSGHIVLSVGRLVHAKGFDLLLGAWKLVAPGEPSWRLRIVGSGEDAPALRKGLEAEGVRFKTRSDTEVILRLYEKNPERVEEHLVGMWAFAVHDRRRKKLVLSRDRFGIKPLFIADAGRGLAFASELRCFRSVRPLGLESLFGIDHGSAHAMLSWAYVPNEDTIYSGVKRLAPATRLEVDLTTGQRTERRYWSLRPSDASARVSTLDEACALVEPLLRRAVTEHLESDVPVAAFLSGGIDSSLIAQHAALASSRPIKAFTIGFREPRFDESPFARRTAEKLGLDLHVEILDEKTALDSVTDALAAYDEPFGDSSSLATFLLAKVVARTHKVALGGDGGDEVFAGYKKHRIVAIRDLVARAPALRDLAARAIGALPSRTDRTTRHGELLRTAKRVARGLGGGDAEAYLALTQVGALAKTAPLVTAPADPERFEAPILREFAEAGGSQIRRTLVCDLRNVLPNDMLVKVDRASMAHHLEARVPLLDHRLVEAGVGLPQRFTLGRSGKAVLRELHERRFGRALARRKKQGFGVPVEAWMRGPLAPECERLFAAAHLEKYGVLSSAALGGGKWKEWRRTDPQLLWHAFALARWCEEAL